jgi:hypothetical protein
MAGRWAAGIGLLLAATAPWSIPVSADGSAMLRTVLSLHLTGSFRFPPAAPGTRFDPYMFRTAPGSGKGIVEAYPPLGTLIRAGLLAPSDALPAGLPRGRFADAALQLLPIIVSALTVLPLARLAHLGGCSKRASPILAAALVGTTFIGPLGRLDFQEPLLVFLSVFALERALVARRLPKRRRRLLATAGALFSAALLAKPTALVLLPALVLSVARPRRGRPSAADAAALLAGSLPGLVLFLGLNTVRFGDPFDLGYRWSGVIPGAERVGVAWTFLRLTLLPNRGLLWFAPLLLLAFFSVTKKFSSGPGWTDRIASGVAAAGFFGANLFWWSWDGGFGWGPRLLAPALALSIPWLAGRTRSWRLAAVGLAVIGLGVNGPSYLLDYGRIYSVVVSRAGDARPLGPAVPVHLDPAAPGNVHRLQLVHYAPRHATWLEAPPLLARLLVAGDGPATGAAPGDDPNDAALLRLLTHRPALRPYSGVGRMLVADASITVDVEPARALAYSLAAIGFGGPPGDSRALASMLLLRAGRPAEAARLCREGLVLEPGRSDLRQNLAIAESRLRAEAGATP